MVTFSDKYSRSTLDSTTPIPTTTDLMDIDPKFFYSNYTTHISEYHRNGFDFLLKESLDNDALAMSIITGFGIFGNLLLILSIIIRTSLRKVINMFLLHHCFINLTQCLLFIPFILALMNDSETLKGCEILGGTFVTMVTANVLNIAAMTACEAYRFEDFIQEQNIAGNRSIFFKTSKASSSAPRPSITPAGFVDPKRIQKHPSITFLEQGSQKRLSSAANSPYKSPPSYNRRKSMSLGKSKEKEYNSTASFACVIFGLVMIWLASIILHLGITLIGSDSKQFYNHAIRNCFFAVGDKQTYILYIMWIILTTVSLSLTIIYVKKIFQDVSDRKKANSKFFITTPLFFYKTYDEYLDAIKTSKGKPKSRRDVMTRSPSASSDRRSRKNPSSQSYQNLYQGSCRSSLPSHYLNGDLKNSRGFMFSQSASDVSKFATGYANHNYNHNSNTRCSSFLFANQNGMDEYTSAHARSSSFRKRKYESEKRRYDIIKQILQRIKIQFIVIMVFIFCWMPLFVTVTFDAGFEVSPIVYRYLTIIAFSNSSIMPYCYLTILIPGINKYCFPFLRTDGKISNKKTAYYNAVESYYEKLGDRLHNGSNQSSDLELNKILESDDAAKKPPDSVLKETSFYERAPKLKYATNHKGSMSFDDDCRSARRNTTSYPMKESSTVRAKAPFERSFLNLVENRAFSFQNRFELAECEQEDGERDLSRTRHLSQSQINYNPSYPTEKPSSTHFTPILGLRPSREQQQQQAARRKSAAYPTDELVESKGLAADKRRHLQLLRQLSLSAYDYQPEPCYSSQQRMMRSPPAESECATCKHKNGNILEIDYI